MKKSISIALLLGLILLLATGCTPATEELTYNLDNIDEYITLGTYKGLEYEPLDVTVTDAEITEVVDQVITENTTTDVVDRAAKEGDVVNMDYVGYIDGEEFEGNKAEGADVTLGSGSLIDGFEDGLLGAVAGEERSLHVTFPDDYHNETYSGKSAVFEVTVNEVKEINVPVLDAAFVATVSSYTTVEEFLTGVHDELEALKLQDALYNLENILWAMAVENATIIEYPEKELNEYQENTRTDIESEASAAGYSLEVHLMSNYDMTLEEFEVAIEDQAKNLLKSDLFLVAIQKAENITITDEAIDAGVTEYTSILGFESEEEFLTTYSKDIVRLNLIYDEIIALLMDESIEKAAE